MAAANTEWRARAAELDRTFDAHIGGATVASSGAARLDLVHPGDASFVGTLPLGTDEDADRAVCAARRAFDHGGWRHLPPVERKELLLALAALIERDSEILALHDTLDIGKPITQSLAEARAAAAYVRFFAETCDKQTDILLPSDHGALSLGRREPLGVVAAIVAWNFPILNLVSKMAPALAAGNALVVKPSEMSPSSALHVARLADEAGFPPGVMNVVLGRGATVGRALSEHAGVDLISFTGSTATALAIVGSVGRTRLRRMNLECGGKSAEIVLDDLGDPVFVADRLFDHAFYNQGQLCVASSRLILHVDLYDRIVGLLAERLARIVPGDVFDESTDYGPLASAARREELDRRLAAALQEGATIVAEGGRPSRPSDAFAPPRMLDDTASRSPTLGAELFGPILALYRVQSAQEALALANATDYGLSAKLWTRDPALATGFARALNVGEVKIFSSTAAIAGAGFAVGMEPAGQSGFGIEGGASALAGYSRLKSIEHFTGTFG